MKQRLLITLFLILASFCVKAQNTNPLPPGLTLSSSGLLSGTPTTAGTYSFKVQVCDTETPPQCSQVTPFQITIYAPVVIGTSSPLPAGAVGIAYQVQFAATGGSGTYSWSTQ